MLHVFEITNNTIWKKIGFCSPSKNHIFPTTTHERYINLLAHVD